MIKPIYHLDLQKQYAFIKTEILEALENTLDNAEYSGGANIERFESAFASFCHADFAIAVNNGTSALHLAMIVNNVGPGDEVIVPANTFIATAWAPLYVGAAPIFVDCDSANWHIKIENIEAAITPKTKAIIGVHLYGQPCDLDGLLKLCAKYNIRLIEDAAQAHGATYNGRSIGTFSQTGCFSFYPTKNLGTYGEGGAIITNNYEIKERLLQLRNNGSRLKYYHDEIGYNMRMGGLESAVLSVKLNYIQSWNTRRQHIANLYKSKVTSPHVKFQASIKDSVSAYHLMVITTEDRGSLTRYLNSKSIYPALHYPVPCHLQKALQHLGYKKGDFPNAEYLADHCLSLPMYPELTDEELGRVIDALNSYQL